MEQVNETNDVVNEHGSLVDTVVVWTDPNDRIRACMVMDSLSAAVADHRATVEASGIAPTSLSMMMGNTQFMENLPQEFTPALVEQFDRYQDTFRGLATVAAVTEGRSAYERYPSLERFDVDVGTYGNHSLHVSVNRDRTYTVADQIDGDPSAGVMDRVVKYLSE